MNRTAYNQIIEDFKRAEERLKSLSTHDTIYEMDLMDPEGGAYFKHEVVSVDLDAMCVNTLDHSKNGKPSRLYSYSTPAESGLKDVCDECDGDGWVHHDKSGQGGDIKDCPKCNSSTSGSPVN